MRLLSINSLALGETVFPSFNSLALWERVRVRDSGFDHESFIMGMHNLTLLRTESLIKAVGLKGVKTMLDVEGGPGTNAVAFAKKGVKSTIFTDFQLKATRRPKKGSDVKYNG